MINTIIRNTNIYTKNHNKDRRKCKGQFFTPLSVAEFMALRASYASQHLSILEPGAGKFLKQLENLPHKETLRGVIADYIIDELVINNVAQKYPDELSRGAYAYYRMLYNQSMDSSI